MNIYRLTVTGHIYKVGPQVYVMALSPDALTAKVERIQSGSLSVEVEVVSTSLDCARCGHRYSYHFEGKGVCDLGFCPSRCSDFVPTP